MTWFILIAILKLHIATGNSLLCAGIYATAGAVFGLAGGHALGGVAIGTSISFGLAWVYFAVLSRIEAGGMWWFAAIGLPLAAAAAQGGPVLVALPCRTSL